MSIVKIYVKSNGKTPPGLILSDSVSNPGNDQLTTLVNPGDQIEWLLDERNGKSGLDSIENIMKFDKKKDGTVNPNIFAPMTGKSSSNKHNITASIVSTKLSGKGSLEEYYVIEFKLPGDNTIYMDDPKLKMKL